jgi:hypothetical protein
VFSEAPEREGIDEAFMKDVDRQGRSIDSFMKHISHLTTACKWAWIGIDMPVVDGEVTIAQARENKIRPYWTAYAANEVADWYFNEVGDLQWLITEAKETEAPDPTSEAIEMLVRRLWMLKDGRCHVRTIKIQCEDGRRGKEKPKILSDEEMPLSITFIPFVCVGEISDKPHWFDDVQDVQAAILDLESANDTMYFKHVYQQLVLPATMAQDITGQTGRQDLGQSVSAIVGGAYSIVEQAEEKGISRVIAPSGDALGKIQDELQRKRQVLFDTVGLHLQIDSKQIESADAKNLDRLDSNAVLAEKAQVLEEAEIKAVELTKMWDADFAEYEPVYNDSFDVSNLKEDVEAIIMLNNLDLPDSSKRLLNKAALDKVRKVSHMSITEDEYKVAQDDIEDQSFSVPFAPSAADGVDDLSDLDSE